MNKKILFSPVGGTDPISQKNYCEGALMQIARYWRPDIICLYMSKEILENQANDGGEGRYLYCLHRLEESIGCNFDIYIIPREGLDEVQLFNPLYEDFEMILASIEEKKDDTDELWLNISSGTPAMKSALLVLATMLDSPAKCIQVDTPDKKMNEHSHDKWDLEDYWDFDTDNSPDSVDRTHSEQLPSLKLLKYEENIKRFVREYDYNAALKLAEGMDRGQMPPYIDKLRIAKARRELNSKEVDTFIKRENKKETYLPCESSDCRTLYEYILDLQAKVDRNEYADFLRGLSPVFVSLFAAILKTNTTFNLKEYSSIDNDGALIWKTKKFNGTEFQAILDNAYQQSFNGKYVSADHLCKLAGELLKDENIKKCVEDLRMVEKKARNIAAHNMIYVDDNWIKEKTGYSSSKIIDKIHTACGYTGMAINHCRWDSYNKMNDDITLAISKEKEQIS